MIDQDGNAAGSTSGTYGPATAPGIWQVDVGNREDQDIDLWAVWNISALDESGVEIPGRVWSELYTARQESGPAAAEDFRFWAVNDTGYIYDVVLNDYNGMYSTIRADAIGNVVAEGECEPLYESVDSGVPGEWTPIPECGGKYRVFFNEPAEDLPEQANLAGETVYVKPAPLMPEDIQVENFVFDQEQRGSLGGTFTWDMGERFNGAYWLEIDVDGDGEFTSEVDRRIPLYSGEGRDSDTGTISYDFDGLDGTGAAIQTCTPIQSRVYFDRLGEIHISQEDVEYRGGGISVTRTNGPEAPDSTLYWDDTALSTEGRGSVPSPLDATAGVDSSGGVHSWTWDSDQWGNNRVIDDWAYYPAMLTGAETTIGTDGCLELEKTSDASDATRVGDTVTYTVTATNTGEFDYTEEMPAVVIDDLTGVLDDADFNDDATATQEGEVSYENPLLSWTGPLASGESVELTYTVMLKAGGDRNVRNTAFIPDGPPPSSGEIDCTDAVDGIDPETGLLCDSVDFDLPALTISKVADTTELPEDGGTVTYTITVTNEGPGVTTAEEPSSFTDDLSDVLDDGDFVDDSLEASVGAATRDGDELSWSGPLGVDESATVTYQVEYDANKGGTNELLNVACLPVELALDPADPCRQVTVPGALLQQWKTSDPGSGSSLDAGDEVTYTLHFLNTGQAPATVDNSDDLAEVLDDAELIDGPTSSNGALTVTREGTTIVVTGSVAPGEEYTVDYTVRVNAFADQGDHVLANGLAECDPANENRCETTHPIRALDVEKVSDAQATRNGDTISYTVRVTNIGAGDYTVEEPATMTDDLSGVIDDATFNEDAAAPVGEVSYEEPTLAWAGPLAAGETVEVTYSVTVTSAGDYVLLNTACIPNPGEDDSCATVETPLPHLTFAKSSDPDSGEDVLAGQVITYTLTYTNDGQAPGVVDSVDDLTEVLDDADVTAAPVSSSDAVTATLLPEAIRVVGPIEPGETVTVTYEVTVKPDGERGDHELVNVLVPDNPDDPPVPPVTHDVPELVDYKSVDPASGTTVQPGGELVYTLHFRNDGAAPAVVDREDVLTGVLDDATISAAPAASDEALSVSEIEDGRFAITGTLAAGQEATVSYTVTVNADGERGDDRLGNFLLDPGEDPPNECVVAEGELPDCTVNHVSDVEVTKSADPDSGTEVDPGEVVTYTLTFTNISTNTEADPAEVDYTDHLADVLDDAELTSAAVSSDPALAVTSAAESIRIVGALGAGEVVTVTYAVTVVDYDDQGDHVLGNVVAVTGEEPVCAPGSDLCTEHPVTDPPAGGALPPTDPLPSTGANQIGLWVLAALGAIGAGIALLGAGRRRNGRIGWGQSTSSTN